ncbi:PadR family transcriptional regulator [Herbidospora sp. NBRC 101105]|uniref:PadR family transcriptional regulator n=1 Tax=Herbidospora sp. NBRC 101105 TaxID=3032195 RepID=UPI0024A5FECB|nr:PadR family transcriptional regulator [Herbidospora sp. NBRC 101105]GLX95329.1 PadR family transcriptional regulator [Herbidospora sp. NBRC 101105]
MSLRHALLGLLSEGPASGYDLLKLFENSLANVWPATQSQLYGELGRLADAGLITVRSEGARGRKEYAVTEAGREELRHWLLDVKPAPIRRYEMLLRVFFFGQISTDDAIAYLREQQQAAEAAAEHLAEIGKLIAHHQDNFTVYGRLALEWGVRSNRLHQEWAEWAIGEVKAHDPTANTEPCDPS